VVKPANIQPAGRTIERPLSLVELKHNLGYAVNPAAASATLCETSFLLHQNLVSVDTSNPSRVFQELAGLGLHRMLGRIYLVLQESNPVLIPNKVILSSVRVSSLYRNNFTISSTKENQFHR
jgi:hypothetical protein